MIYFNCVYFYYYIYPIPVNSIVLSFILLLYFLTLIFLSLYLPSSIYPFTVAFIYSLNLFHSLTKLWNSFVSSNFVLSPPKGISFCVLPSPLRPRGYTSVYECAHELALNNTFIGCLVTFGLQLIVVMIVINNDKNNENDMNKEYKLERKSMKKSDEVFSLTFNYFKER